METKNSTGYNCLFNWYIDIYDVKINKIILFYLFLDKMN